MLWLDGLPGVRVQVRGQPQRPDGGAGALVLLLQLQTQVNRLLEVALRVLQGLALRGEVPVPGRPQLDACDPARQPSARVSLVSRRAGRAAAAAST